MINAENDIHSAKIV